MEKAIVREESKLTGGTWLKVSLCPEEKVEGV